MTKRAEFVAKAKSWTGTKEGSKGHKQIIADYNKAADAGRKAGVNTAWCAVFVGACAEETGNVLAGGVGVPVDYSCGTGKHSLIEKAKAAGIWNESDDYTPREGDIIIYDWKDNGKGDDTTGHDHTGIVTSAAAKSFVVTEGNKTKAVGNADGVGTRRVNVNAKNIRGFICPVFADEVQPAPAPDPTPEPTPAPVPDAGTTYKVVGVNTNLRIRKAPTTSADVIGRLANGDEVQVYDTRNGYAEVKNCTCYTDPTLTKKKTVDDGWASLKYLKKV